MRRAAHHALSAFVVVALALTSVRAGAEEPEADTADGMKTCAAFRAKNARELAAWEQQQPALAYKRPRRDEVLNAPWGALLKGLGTSGEVLLASIIPHVGAQLRADTPAAVISWPWSLALGPASACSRKRGSFEVDLHRPHRIVLEPGIISSNRGVGVFARPGYRFVQHPSDWVVGVGAGLGSTIEIAGNREPFRIGIGPEILAHFGHCCTSGYFTLAFRYDRFFTGGVLDLFTGTLGYTFF